MSGKEEIRKEFRRVRKGLSEERRREAAEALKGEVLRLVPEGLVMSFWSLGDEIGTGPLNEALGERLVLPRVHDGGLEMRRPGLVPYRSTRASDFEQDTSDSTSPMVNHGRGKTRSRLPKAGGIGGGEGTNPGRQACELVEGPYGLMEPSERCERVHDVGCVLVPGLAFDERGHRVGYGMGYYDRCLAGVAERVVVYGVAFKEQLVGLLPVEAHDVPVHKVLSF